MEMESNEWWMDEQSGASSHLLGGASEVDLWAPPTTTPAGSSITLPPLLSPSPPLNQLRDHPTAHRSNKGSGVDIWKGRAWRRQSIISYHSPNTSCTHIALSAPPSLLPVLASGVVEGGVLAVMGGGEDTGGGNSGCYMVRRQLFHLPPLSPLLTRLAEAKFVMVAPNSHRRHSLPCLLFNSGVWGGPIYHQSHLLSLINAIIIYIIINCSSPTSPFLPPPPPTTRDDGRSGESRKGRAVMNTGGGANHNSHGIG